MKIYCDDFIPLKHIIGFSYFVVIYSPYSFSIGCCALSQGFANINNVAINILMHNSLGKSLIISLGCILKMESLGQKYWYFDDLGKCCHIALQKISMYLYSHKQNVKIAFL